VVPHVVEVAFLDRPHEVTSADNPLDLQLRTDSSLGLKECAINEGVGRFPSDSQYDGYVDGDFHFTRQDWALEAIHMLQHHTFCTAFQYLCRPDGKNSDQPSWAPTLAYEHEVWVELICTRANF
jgi:hypothetical protein